MKIIRRFSSAFAAVICIGLPSSGASAQAPPPLITEAFADPETATLTFNGAGFRAGFPTVFLGNHELSVRWATEATVTVWLPELLRPGTYRLVARWTDGAQADFYLTLGGGAVALQDRRNRSDGRASPDSAALRTFGGDGRGCVENRYQHSCSRTMTAAAGGALEQRAARTGNTRHGTNALQSLTTGAANTAAGEDGLADLTIGISNVAVGWRALTWLNTGSLNTAIGAVAMQQVGLDVRGNTAVGRGALRQIKGSNNVGIGLNAGSVYDFPDGTGSDNIFIGSRPASRASAAANRTGSNNIYIGGGLEGVAGESGIIRIGRTGTHSETHLTGNVYLPQAVFLGSTRESLEGLLADIEKRIIELDTRLKSLAPPN